MNSESLAATHKRYLPTLDGWRAVAILGVMIYHGTSALFDAGGTYPNARLFALVRYGTLGVPVFFGISGFLICTRLLQEEKITGRISLWRFYLRRSCRILPPYLTYLGVLSLIAAAGIIAVDSSEWLSCLLFYRNYVMPQSGGYYTSHFWSLAVEEHFYLLWPGILVLCGSRRARRVVVVFALIVAAWRAVEFRNQWLTRLLPRAGFSWRTDIRIDGLLWGCWVALLLIIPKWHERLTRWLSFWPWLAVVGLFISVVLLGPYLTPLWSALLIPLILVGTVLNPTSLISRILELSALRWIGRLSYSLYIWQQLFLVAKAELRLPALAWTQHPPLSFVLVFACATLSYYLIERPMIDIGHRATNSPKPKRVTEADLATAEI